MILVSEQNSLHVSRHAFSRPFYAQTFVPMCQRKHFYHTFYQRLYSNRTIACVLCFIWHPSFVRNYSGILSTFFSIHDYYALTISLNHHHQTEVSSLKDFSTYSLTSVITQQFILLPVDSFFYLDYFFHNKDFLAFCKIFSTSHIAWGIIKLIAWTTSFLEERLDSEITWLVLNANNATMSPPWPINVHLYLKRSLLIRNAWRTNHM